ncbi:MAG: SpoIIE family protein phosphatase [Wenzhouxiangella sp.]
MNLPAQFLALRERFIAGLPERLVRMRQHHLELANPNPDRASSALAELKRMAHSLVGAAGLHELNALAEAAARLEGLAAAGELESLAAALAELEQQALAQQTSPPSPAKGMARSQRIGLLFQSRNEMTALAALLEGQGHQVSTFNDLGSLVRVLQSESPPALILMGRQFDGDDAAGLVALKALKDGPAQSTPVLMVSGCRSIEGDLAAYRAGAERVLTKPVAPPMLARHVQEALTVKGMAPINTLLLTSPEEAGIAFDGASKQTLAVSSHDQLDTFFAALDRQRPELILIAVAQPPADTAALIRRVADHRNANFVPIVWLSRSVEAADHQPPACWLLAPADQPIETLGRQLQGLHQRARRIRQFVDDLERYRYENQRHADALDRHAIISLADASGTIYASSARHSTLTGFARTQIIGAHLAETRPGMAPPEFTADILAELRKQECWQGDYALPTAHGRPCWVDTTLVPFKHPDGRIYRYMVIRSDITERRLSEQALLAASQREIALAGQIQDSLLVPPMPGVLGGALLASRFQAAEGVAGDFHAVSELAPGVFDVLIGDVMGKGVPAALIGAACKMHYHQALLEQLTGSGERLPGLASLMAALQQRLSSQLMALECFVTLSYARFDRNQGVISLIGCGHPPLLLLDQGKLETSSNQHPPLGLVIEEQFDESHLAWPPGSTAVLYSDGLSESESSSGEPLGEAGLQAIVRTQCTAETSPLMASACILAEVDRHADLGVPADDRTLLVISNPARHSYHRELPASLEAVGALHQLLSESPLHAANQARRDSMVLASVEAFTNLVKHARLTTPRIQVSLWQPRPDEMTVSLCFDGPDHPPPEASPLPDPERLSESGLGLALIGQLCDSFEYHHGAGCNRQTLRFSGRWVGREHQDQGTG